MVDIRQDCYKMGSNVKYILYLSGFLVSGINKLAKKQLISIFNNKTIIKVISRYGCMQVIPPVADTVCVCG